MSYDGKGENGRTPDEELKSGLNNVAKGVDKLNDLAAIKEGLDNKKNNKDSNKNAEGSPKGSSPSNANNLSNDLNTNNLGSGGLGDNNKPSTNDFLSPDRGGSKPKGSTSGGPELPSPENALSSAKDMAKDVMSGNGPSMKDNRMADIGNKKKGKGNKKSSDKQSPGNKIIEEIKKRQKQAVKKKLTKVKIKVVVWLISTIASMFMTLGMFILANPVILSVIVGLQVADSVGILGWVKGLFSDDNQQTEAQADEGYLINLFSGVLGTNSNDEADYDAETDPSGDAESPHAVGDYYSTDEYRDSLLKSYDLCKEASKKAYKMAKKEAKQLAKDKDLSNYTIVVAPYDSQEYKSIGPLVTYKDLYKTEESSDGAKDGINWGAVITVWDLLYTTEISEPGEYNPNDSMNIDPDELEDYILDESRLKYFYNKPYYIEISQDKYVIVIKPFDLTDLFKMSLDRHITPETLYDNTTTYYDMYQLHLRQMQEVLSTDETYKKLGLYNDVPLNRETRNTYIPDLGTNNVTVENIDGNTNAEKIWNAFKDAGFTDIGAAAVLGNLEHENHFRTSMSGDQGSVGLAQWLNDRKTALIDYANSVGKQPTDIDVQVYYLINIDFPRRMSGVYSPTGRSYYDEVKNATDLNFATDLVCAYFETPARFYSYDSYLHSKYHDRSRADFVYNINWDRFVKTDVYYSYQGTSGNWYWLDIRYRRSYANNRYNEFHK